MAPSTTLPYLNHTKPHVLRRWRRGCLWASDRVMRLRELYLAHKHQPETRRRDQGVSIMDQQTLPTVPRQTVHLPYTHRQTCCTPCCTSIRGLYTGGTVWSILVNPYSSGHSAVKPPLILPWYTGCTPSVGQLDRCNSWRFSLVLVVLAQMVNNGRLSSWLLPVRAAMATPYTVVQRWIPATLVYFWLNGRKTPINPHGKVRNGPD